TGPGTISAGNIRLYREDLLSISSSRLSAGTSDDVPGSWPDALVPKVDEVYNEARTGFPFSIPSGQTRAIWVDIFVPPGTPRGDYSGTVTITFNEGAISVPVSLHVWNFDLPSTSSIRSLFILPYAAIPH